MVLRLVAVLLVNLLCKGCFERTQGVLMLVFNSSCSSVLVSCGACNGRVNVNNRQERILNRGGGGAIWSSLPEWAEENGDFQSSSRTFVSSVLYSWYRQNFLQGLRGRRVLRSRPSASSWRRSLSTKTNTSKWILCRLTLCVSILMRLCNVTVSVTACFPPDEVGWCILSLPWLSCHVVRVALGYFLQQQREERQF